MNDQLSHLQINDIVQYKIYGDSAYIIVNYSHIRARHETLSSCRQNIECNYNDLKQKWSYIDFKRNLKLIHSNVIPSIICAFILRNAHGTLNGNITSEYFDSIPPSLEHWTSQGPKIFR